MFGDDTNFVDTSANAVDAPAAVEAAPVEEVTLVKMQRDYDGRIELVHPDGVADYLQSPNWKVA